MTRSFIRYVVAAVFAVAMSVSAAEPAEGAPRKQALPEGVVAQFSFAEPQAFLDGLYAYIDAATKNTGYYIPGEMLPMIAVAYSPVPLDVWDVNDELHVFMLGDPDQPDAAALFHIASFEELLSGLEATNWAIDYAAATAVEGGDAITDLRSAVMPNGSEMLLADLGDGRAVLAEDEDAVRLVAALAPAHGSDADFVARVRADGPLGEELVGFSEYLFEEITGDADDIVESVVDAGLTEEAGQWLAGIAAKYGRAVGEEIEKAEEVALELSFVDNRLVAGLSVLSADGSRTRRLAEAIEAGSEGDFPDGALLKRLPEGYFSAGVTAPMTGFMPELKALSEAVLSDIAELAPELKTELLVNNKLLSTAEPGAMASANYLAGGAPYQVLLTEYGDAQAALDAMAGMGGVFNDILAESFADPAESFSIVKETQSDGGREWHSWRIETARAEGGFNDFLRRIDRAASAGMMAAGTVLDPNFRVYAARLEKPEAMLVVTGALGREEFAALLHSVAESAGDAETPFDNPEVQTTAEALGAAQFSIGQMNPGYLSLLFALQYAAATGRELPASSFGYVGDADAGADMVFGGGAEDGRLTARLALPATAVNAGIRMHEMLEAAFARAAEPETEAETEAEAEAEAEAEEAPAE